MTKYDNDPVVIRDLLHTRATWAVVGLSTNRSRTAYSIAQFLKVELGMRIVPVHPRARAAASAAAAPRGSATRARDAGLAVVMDSCPRIEYPRVQPGDGAGAIAG